MDAKAIVDKFKLKEKHWIHKEFHAVFHFFAPILLVPFQNLKPYYNDTYSFSLTYLENGIAHWYWYYEEMVKIRDAFLRKVKRKPQVLQQLEKDWKAKLKILDKKMKQIDNTDLRKLSSSEILSLYLDLYHSYLEPYGIAVSFQDPFSMLADEFLVPHFQKVLQKKGYGDKFNEYFPILTAQSRESFSVREHTDRLKLIISIKSLYTLTAKDKQKIEDHIRQHEYVQNNYAGERPLTLAKVLSEMKKITRAQAKAGLESIGKRNSEVQKQKRTLIKKLQLDSYSELLVEMTDLFAYMQDERKRNVLRMIHYHTRFLKVLAQRLKISFSDAKWLRVEELAEILNGKKTLDQKTIEERKRATILIGTKEQMHIYGGELAKKINECIFSKRDSLLQEVKGVTASSGIAVGRVVVLHRVEDLRKVKKGDIIVASMTRPELVPGMKLAAAIVTDEGGITSHAAVISRELGIPCIVGAKVALQLFQDGDWVEVDATKGIVKKIS